MIKRPLCMACLLFLAVQAVRVFGLKSAADQQPSALERAASEGTRLTLAGTVDRIEEKEKVTAVFLKDNTVSVRGQHVNESKLLVYIEQNSTAEIKTGNIIQVSGEVSPFDPARNPGNFDQKAYYQRQGIHVLVWADDFTVLSSEADRVKEFLSALRSRWKTFLTGHLGEYYGNTMSAVLLGDKNGLDDEMKKLYQKNGIGHLLAISGLHMSFIGMGIYGILRKAGLSFIPAGIMGSVVLGLYTLMIGAGVSSLRALVMFLMRIGADMTGRDYDLPTSLSLAAAAVCAWQPLYLADAGFLLSFGAILGICLFSPVFSEMFTGEKQKNSRNGDVSLREKLRRAVLGLAESLSSSMAVSLMLLGPTLYFYFEIPPYSVFLNILVIPVMPLAMGAGLAGLLLCPVSEPAGAAVLQVCRGVLWFYDRACTAAGNLPGSRIVTGQPALSWLFIYYSMLFLLAAGFFRLMEVRRREGERFRRRKLIRGTGAVLLLFGGIMTAACRAGHAGKNEVRVTVLDVGQGDGIHVRGPSGINYFIDGGSSDVSSVGIYRIEPYLLSRAVDCLDYVFVTHGDLDHYSGIMELVEDQELGVRIRTLVLPPEEYRDERLRELGRTAAVNGIRVAEIAAGQSLEEKNGRFSIACLAPETGAGIQPGNAASLVLELRFGAFGMLLTGDVEAEGEEALLKSGRLGQCQILKAAHHGSKNSGSEAFLEKVRPAVAIISAGVGNRYGHPHRETLERLSEAGCSVCSTQESGAVTVVSDGNSIRLGGFLGTDEKAQDGS
ncbi:MAG: DNA internalization-related competence protein ComEC/Rec2 [Mediterraneibacter sp.]